MNVCKNLFQSFLRFHWIRLWPDGRWRRHRRTLPCDYLCCRCCFHHSLSCIGLMRIQHTHIFFNCHWSCNDSINQLADRTEINCQLTDSRLIVFSWKNVKHMLVSASLGSGKVHNFFWHFTYWTINCWNRRLINDENNRWFATLNTSHILTIEKPITSTEEERG